MRARPPYAAHSVLGALASQRDADERLRRESGGLPRLIEGLELPSLLPPLGQAIEARVPLRLVGTPIERRGRWMRDFVGSLSLPRGQTSTAVALLDAGLLSSLVEGAYALAERSRFASGVEGLRLPSTRGGYGSALLAVAVVIYTFPEPAGWFVATEASIRVAVLRDGAAAIAVLVVEAGSARSGEPLISRRLDELLGGARGSPRSGGQSGERGGWRSEWLPFDDLGAFDDLGDSSGADERSQG